MGGVARDRSRVYSSYSVPLGPAGLLSASSTGIASGATLSALLAQCASILYRKESGSAPPAWRSRRGRHRRAAWRVAIAAQVRGPPR